MMPDRQPLKLAFNYKSWGNRDDENRRRNITIWPTKHSADIIKQLMGYGIEINAEFSPKYNDAAALRLLARQAVQDFEDRGIAYDPAIIFLRRNSWIERLGLKAVKTEITIGAP